MSVNLCSLFVLVCGFTGVYSTPIMIASLLPADQDRSFNIQKVAPAISIAIDKVTKPDGVLPGREIIVQYADSKCSIADGMNEAINYYVKKQVHVFFGPVCDYAAAPISRQARYWDIPLVTTGAMARDFAIMKHIMFPLLTRVGPNVNSMINFIVALLKEFHWNKVKLLYEPNGHSHVMERFCHIAIDGIHFGLQAQIKNFSQEYTKFDHVNELLETDTLATTIGNNHAVVVLCASPDAVREIMIKAHELNFDNGEYVFFNIDLFSSNNDSKRPWFRDDDTEDRNNKARKAYEALMTVTLRKPTSPEYKKFSAEVKRRAKEMYVNFTYGEEEVNSFVGAFHDAVILYALALNETLEANIPITNGSEITTRMWNRTFEGITGTVSIDGNGDRNADYSLLDLNPETDVFEVVANYYGNKKQYEPVEGRFIHWAGGRNQPPPDTPDCGFDGSKCPPDEPFPEYGIVIIVLGSIILIVLIAAFFIYRNTQKNTFKDFSKTFGIDEAEVKRRMKEMKVVYKRERERQDESPKDNVIVPKEPYSEHLSLLDDFVSTRSSVSRNDDEQEVCLEEHAQVTAAELTTTARPSHMRNSPDDASMTATETTAAGKTSNKLPSDTDDDDADYGRYVSSTLRSIKDMRAKKIIKVKIREILSLSGYPSLES